MKSCRYLSLFFLFLGFMLNFYPDKGFAEPQSSVTQWGITWYFDKNYEVGQFANGDYWVVGPVTITRITPDFNGKHHGWEVNPRFRSLLGNSGEQFRDGPQGFDCGARGFDASLVPALPYVANSGQSIVKGISRITDPNDCRDGFSAPLDPRTNMDTAAILTVLASIPPNRGNTTFRPPYVGDVKPYYSTENLRTDLLPSFPLIPNTPPISSVKYWVEKVQLEHEGSIMGANIKPMNNLESYAPSVARELNQAMIWLSLNFPLSMKKPILIDVIQGGIDRYHAILSGQTWPAGRGIQPGHKLSVVFAAIMLDSQEMKNKLLEPQMMEFFSEDQALSVGLNGAVLWGKPNDRTPLGYWEYFNSQATSSESIGDPYSYIDGGNNLYRSANGYQVCCYSGPFQGATYMLKLMPSLQTVWVHSSRFISYWDRWKAIGAWYQPDECAPVDPVDLGKPRANWTKYGITWGHDSVNNTCIKDRDPSDGTGRFPNRHGAHRNDLGGPVNDIQNGSYITRFQRTAYDAFVLNINRPPVPTHPWINNLDLYFSFNDNIHDQTGRNFPTGAIAPDSSSGQLAPLNPMSLVYETGVVGKAVSLSGTNGVASDDISEYSELDGLPNMTIAFFAKRNVATARGIILEKYEVLEFGFNDTGFYVDFVGGAPYTKYRLSSGAATGTSWHHFALVLNNLTAILYIDGVEVARRAVTGQIFGNDRALVLGRGLFSNGVAGAMDEYMHYSRALNAEEILRLSQGSGPINIAPAPASPSALRLQN
jgi:Concanavalin A-like lectin/glucanases superfamily